MSSQTHRQDLCSQDCQEKVRRSIETNNRFLEEHKKLDMVKQECAILSLVKHPNITELYDWFETRDKFYMVFDLASGGELFDRIVQKGKFTERDAAVIIATIINAVKYLHDPPHEIVHRDLKPENLLFKDKAPDSQLVLVDFGISKVLEGQTGNVMTTVCGSPGYTAPEVLRRVPYGKTVDMYSCGVITYTLLCGYGPFSEAKDLVTMCDRIVLGQYEFESPWWDNVSPLAKEFVKKLMEAKPEKRLTASEALEHEWITSLTPAGYIKWLKDVNWECMKREYRALGLEPPADSSTVPIVPQNYTTPHQIAKIETIARLSEQGNFPEIGVVPPVLEGADTMTSMESVTVPAHLMPAKPSPDSLDVSDLVSTLDRQFPGVLAVNQAATGDSMPNLLDSSEHKNRWHKALTMLSSLRGADAMFVQAHKQATMKQRIMTAQGLALPSINTNTTVGDDSDGEAPVVKGEVVAPSKDALKKAATLHG